MTEFIKKIFVFFTLFLFISLPVRANETLNTLSDIKVSVKGTDYTLTLGFKEKFNESAFVQKQEDGYFHIFIPDAVLSSEDIKIKYNIPKKIYKPQIDFEQRKYIKNNSDSRYVRIDVFTDDDATVSVITEHYKSKLIGNVLKTTLFLFFFSLLFSVLYFSHKYLPQYYSKKKYNTFVPESFTDNSSNGYKTYKRNFHLETEPAGESLFDSVLTFGVSDFKCFEIHDKVNVNNKKIKIESSVSKAKEITLSEKQTNPLVMNFDTDLSEFAAASKITDKKKDNQDSPCEKDELISLLNVTPTKGFVLKRISGVYSLFSFNGASQRLLKTFDKISVPNLQTRFYDKNKQGDIYIVSIDGYKSMVEFSENDVKELMVL